MLRRKKRASSLFPLHPWQTQQFHAVAHSFAQRCNAISSILEQFPHSFCRHGGGTPLPFFQRRANGREVRRSCPGLCATLHARFVRFPERSPRGHPSKLPAHFVRQQPHARRLLYSRWQSSAPSSLELVNGKLARRNPNLLYAAKRPAPEMAICSGRWLDAEVRVVIFVTRNQLLGDTLYLWCFASEEIPAKDLPIIRLLDTGGDFSRRSSSRVQRRNSRRH